MNYWPVPNSYSKKVPVQGDKGSFWENRRDRHHCGVDIYAPKGSEVVSIDGGKVIVIDEFTSPKILPFWNVTKYVLIQSNDDLFFKYAELEDTAIAVGQKINAGELIGHVGSVLNFNKISHESPKYIQEIKKNKNASMLHLEVYSGNPTKSNHYLGGNWFGNEKPNYILNPKYQLINTI